MARQTGTWVQATLNGQPYKAFVPAPLPPHPPIKATQALLVGHERALVALGRLDGISRMLPDPETFLYAYVRKEALLSSQIEGTQSSLSDLLLFELDASPGVPLDDVREVSDYVDALEHGLARMRGGFPLSLRLLHEMHERLLRRRRGKSKSPGEFRRSPVWLGGPSPDRAQFVPPPVDRLDDCLNAFERFLHAEGDGVPPLTRAGLAHVQFETIHPFLDGNGRLGRMLIVVMLCGSELLARPSLYLSLHFKVHRDEYYARLQAVREQGGWEEWLAFFYRAVEETSNQAVATADRLLRLFETDRARIRAIGRVSGTALKLHERFMTGPLQRIPKLGVALGLSKPTVMRGLKALEKLEVVREVTGKSRYQVYAYQPYLDILSEGAQPL